MEITLGVERTAEDNTFYRSNRFFAQLIQWSYLHQESSQQMCGKMGRRVYLHRWNSETYLHKQHVVLWCLHLGSTPLQKLFPFLQMLIPLSGKAYSLLPFQWTKENFAGCDCLKKEKNGGGLATWITLVIRLRGKPHKHLYQHLWKGGRSEWLEERG